MSGSREHAPGHVRQGLANSANFADARAGDHERSRGWRLVTVAITSVFAFLGLIFLIALAL